MSSAKALTHTFSNGLTLAGDIRPSTRAAAFRLLMPTGSAGDPAGKEGLSGALWELCYRGAGGMDSRALSDAMDDIGMQRAGMLVYNRFWLSGSDRETVSFGGAVMSENLYTALDLTADIVLRPALDPEELESVRSGELQELASLEDNPQRKLWIHRNRAYFMNEYGSFRTEESLQSLTAEDMVEAHQTRFKPNGAVLSVSGRFEWEQLKDAVEARFGDWEGSAPILPQPIQRADGCYVYIEQDSRQQHIGIQYPAVPLEHEDIYVSKTAISILSDGMDSRLFTEVREKRGLAYAVMGWGFYLKGSGSGWIYSGTTPERAQETLDILIAELKRLPEGVSEEEVAKAKTSLLSDLVMGGESTGARASSAAEDLFHFGRVRSLEEIRAQIEAVTPGAVAEHLREFPPENYTVAVLGPRRLDMPESQ